MKDKKGAEAALYEYYKIANKNVAELCNHQKARTPPLTLNLTRTLNLT